MYEAVVRDFKVRSKHFVTQKKWDARILHTALEVLH
jgi:hypothetical protein